MQTRAMRSRSEGPAATEAVGGGGGGGGGGGDASEAGEAVGGAVESPAGVAWEVRIPVSRHAGPPPLVRPGWSPSDSFEEASAAWVWLALCELLLLNASSFGCF